ncbi:MAG: hypothetical protein QNJ77_00450 [Acidimicrobiia bacterium]|nr:hypothetical protein [Acidimicrobiia bacterium]
MKRLTIRSALLFSLSGLLLAGMTTAAGAIELEDYLADAEGASYAGRQATWCRYGGQTQFNVVSIEHAGSLLMVEGGGSSQMVGGGKYSVVGEASSGLALSGWSTITPADRYVTASANSETRLGREIVVVTVEEDAALRARIWFDNETGAALGSEVYDGNGELFRLSWMLDFDPNPRKIFTMMREQDSTYDVVVAADAGDLPDVVAGYLRVDSYAGPDDSLHAFYTDGLFSFSIFLVDGDLAAGPFGDAETMRVDGSDYRWLLTPTDMWLQWVGGGTTYVLVGDLPPDHLEDVLRELPRPSPGNIFARIWRGLFG